MSEEEDEKKPDEDVPPEPEDKKDEKADSNLGDRVDKLEINIDGINNSLAQIHELLTKKSGKEEEKPDVDLSHDDTPESPPVEVDAPLFTFHRKRGGRVVKRPIAKTKEAAKK